MREHTVFPGACNLISACPGQELLGDLQSLRICAKIGTNKWKASGDFLDSQARVPHMGNLVKLAFALRG